MLLIRVERSGESHQQGARESDDGVEWRAEFVAHVGQKPVLRLTGFFQLDILVVQRPFDAFAIRDIADGTADKPALRRLQRTQTDLHRKFFAVLAQTVEVDTRAHLANARLGHVSGPMPRMLVTKSLRHQDLDPTPQQLAALVAK